jgi:hypothetical protein
MCEERCWRRSIGVLVLCVCVPAGVQAQQQLQHWLGPQDWVRDVAEPILSLGMPGAFDDTHLFAPTVAVDRGRFLLWYCGSRGQAHDLSPHRVPDERVFKLGLATSPDGKHFDKHPGSPVLVLEDARRSVLTPTALRGPDGSVSREDGKMRLWFSSATLSGPNRRHTIHETSSDDGIHWSRPSAVLVDNAYAPAVIKTSRAYEMWYTEPGAYPWAIRHARSDDGHKWTITEKPVLEITQDWEHYLQIYPSVMWIDGVYLMWYASYLDDKRQTTAIGFAASLDGVTWHKHPQNPVLRPDPARAWESHYVSSHSVIRLPDGSYRIWYASRTAPPFTNLYFALNTARWTGPTTRADGRKRPDGR